MPSELLQPEGVEGETVRRRVPSRRDGGGERQRSRQRRDGLERELLTRYPWDRTMPLVVMTLPFPQWTASPRGALLCGCKLSPSVTRGIHRLGTVDGHPLGCPGAPIGCLLPPVLRSGHGTRKHPPHEESGRRTCCASPGRASGSHSDSDRRHARCPGAVGRGRGGYWINPHRVGPEALIGGAAWIR